MIVSVTTQSASPDQYGIILLAFAGVVVLGGLIALYLISRKAPKGVVLAIAAGIYVISWAFGTKHTREALMFSGALRMLGFGGIILGIIDLISKSRHK